MPSLIIQSGKRRGQRLVLPETEVIVGRDDDCQIRLGSSDVSRRHCKLRPSPEGLLVSDLGSRNGTIVNDFAIPSETLLKPGDVLRVGPVEFLVPAEKGTGNPPARTGEPSARKPAKHHDTTDDDIADWLAADEPEEKGGPGDTTITSQRPRQKPSDRPVPPSVPLKKEFESLAEEAADIIRRHRKKVHRKGKG